MGKVGIGVLTAEAFCTTCPGETTSLLGTTRCTFCKTGFYESFEINETVAKVECAPCLKPDGGANCGLQALLGPRANHSLPRFQS